MKYSKEIKPAKVLGARYTIFVRSLVDVGFDFGLDDFPIFDDAYRQPLVDKFIEHYMFQEIGFETPELFRHYINLAFNEIMPYYNQLYKSTLVELTADNEFKHIDNSERTIINSGTTDSNMNDTQTANSKAIMSDTPQNIIVAGEIEGNKWATQANITNNTASGNNTAKTTNISNNTDKYLRTFSGYNSHPADNIIKIRNAIINLDFEIITNEEIKTCFMGVY